MFEINRPDVVGEVNAVSQRYEEALMKNDVAALDAFFWNHDSALRYGVTENLYGFAAIAAFRAARSMSNLVRTVRRSVVTTFGEDFATVSIEFARSETSATGRQSQTWVRFSEGWKIVAAHISLLPGGPSR